MKRNEKAKRNVLIICAFASLGGLLFGMDQGFINGSLHFIIDEMNLSLIQGESYASIMLIGCIVGTILSGWISRTIGRKRTIVLAAVFFTVFTVMGSLTHSIFILFATRFALGLAVGSAAFSVPLYLSEMAPAKIRGAVLATYSCITAIGICLVFFSNSIIGAYFQSWRLMLGVIAAPSLVMLIGVIFIPRSPRWLSLKNKDSEARSVLGKIRETNGEIEFEINEIRKSLKDGNKQSGWKMLKKGFFVRVVVLGIALMLLQQFCGINAVIYYSGEIFKQAGFSNPSAVTVIIGVLNVLMTIIAIRYIDRWGRKPMLYGGLSVMTIMLLVIGILFKTQELGIILSGPLKMTLMASCLVYVASFGVSLGPIMGILCAEIFPLEGRDFGLATAMTTCWVGCTIVVQFSLSIIHHLGGSTLFFIFTACCILGFFLIRLFTPETKGVTLEEIEINLKNGKKLRDIGS